MNWKSKSLFTPSGVTICGFLAIAVLGFTQVSSYNEQTFAECAKNVTFDHDLPLSHPANRCAAKQSEGVSWSSWFTGHSSSYQFHFIDLLELLSRHSGNSQKSPTKN